MYKATRHGSFLKAVGCKELLYVCVYMIYIYICVYICICIYMSLYAPVLGPSYHPQLGPTSWKVDDSPLMTQDLPVCPSTKMQGLDPRQELQLLL